MTVLEIASAIRNHVSDGLSGNVTGQAYSIEQLMDEIDLKRSKLIHQYLHTAKLEKTRLYQNYETEVIVCEKLSHECFDIYSDSVPAIKIPPIIADFNKAAIEYIGLINAQRSFKVYYDIDDVYNHKFRHKTGHREFIWMDTDLDADGMMTGYFFNMAPHDPLKKIRARAIFEHPSQIPGAHDKEYPASGSLQNDIIKALTEEYIRYYRQLNIAPIQIPNQQTDPIS